MSNKLCFSIVGVCLLILILPFFIVDCVIPYYEKKSRDYKAAVDVNDYEKAHECVRIYADKYHSKLKAHAKNRFETEVEEVFAAATEYTDVMAAVYCAEARFIISQGGENANERILYLFNEIPVLGVKPTEGEESKYQDIDFNSYKMYVKTVNQLCDNVFDIAITNTDKKLAAMALSHYLDDPYYDAPFYYKESYVRYSSEAKDKAQKRFDEAVKNGLFD